MATICGVEEAGRGPVIGPMVMCGVLINEEDEPKLRSIGAKDSKLLTPRTRELLEGQIKKMVKAFEVVVISPKEIDNALNDPSLNLNKLEAIYMAKITNKLKPDKVLLDCPSNNPKQYVTFLRQYLDNQKQDIVAEHKADVKYTVVAAASIIAKVTRDAEIEKIKERIGIDFGSGYPSDEKTQLFLRKHWKTHKEIFRTTWASYKNIIIGQKQARLGDF